MVLRIASSLTPRFQLSIQGKALLVLCRLTPLTGSVIVCNVWPCAENKATVCV
jgi:hypothetical protein